MATFFVLQGPDKGRTLSTSDDRIHMGRGGEQLPLSDRTISRRHAEIELVDGGREIRDTNSANGTYVNGVRIQKSVRLKHGDQIRLGGTLLVYGGDDRIEELSGAGIPRDLVTLDAGSRLDASIVSSVPTNDDSVIMAAPETALAVKSWKVMNDLLAAIGNLIDPGQLLRRVMDMLFDELDVDRGMMFIRDGEAGELIPEVVRFATSNERAGVPREKIVASRTILNHVADSREGVLCSNVISDKRFQSGKSVQNLGMRSVICAPIVARENVLGIIHLDVPITRHTYSEGEMRLVTAIGWQTGMAIENTRLVQAALQRERLAAAGETAAYLSHSIKNILQGMRSGADLLQRGLGREELDVVGKGWRILDRNMDKCFALMLNMLAFSKEREPHLMPRDLAGLVNDVVELMQKQADDKGVVLLADTDSAVPKIHTDYDGVHQVLLNLITNSIEAVDAGDGLITVQARFDRAEHDVVITVIDNGPGVPPDVRSKIFEPFFSTKGHGGTGLGMPVARKIVREMGGAVVLTCPDDGGTVVEIRLPSEEKAQSGGDTQSSNTHLGMSPPDNAGAS